MIKINLLGQARPKTTGRGVPLESTVRLLMIAGAIVVAGSFLFLNYVRMGQDLDETSQKIRVLKAEKARLQAVEQQVEQYQREEAVLQQHIDVIEGLQKNRTGGQDLLTAVANTVVRTDQMWLTSLARKGNAITLEGQAASVNAVANFITQLKRSGFFVKVEIKEAKEDDSNPAVATFTFSMTAEVSSAAAHVASSATPGATPPRS